MKPVQYLSIILVLFGIFAATLTSSHDHGALTMQHFQKITKPMWTGDGLQDLLHHIKVSVNCTGSALFCNNCLTLNTLENVFNKTELSDISSGYMSLTLLALLVNGSETVCHENATNTYFALQQTITVKDVSDLEHLLVDLAAILNYTVSLEGHEEHVESGTDNERDHDGGNDHDHVTDHDTDHDDDHVHNHDTDHDTDHNDDHDHDTDHDDDHDNDRNHDHDDEHDDRAACFGIDSLSHEVSLMTSNEIPEVKYSYAIISHLLAGDVLKLDCPLKASRHDFMNSLATLIGQNMSHISFEEMEEMLATIGVGGSVDDITGRAGEDNHEGHDHKRSIAQTTPAAQCFTGEALIEAFGVEHGETIDPNLLPDISMAAVQQIYGKYCHVDATPVTNTVRQVPAWESWGMGVLSVAIISALALIGGLLFPCLNHDFVQDVLTFFIGLAVGTMSGDALLHLIPQAVGLHEHSGDDHGDNHGSSGGIYVEDYSWKMLVVVGAIYVFFLFETFMSKFGHSHLTDQGDCNDESEVPHTDTLKINDIVLDEVRGGKSEREKTVRTISKEDLISSEISNSMDTDTDYSKNRKSFCKLPTVAYMIVIGDILHNFVDGLAIGAGFAGGWREGVTVAIAVLCHELPHELGDFAVLLSTGLSPKQVLLANTLAACCAFIGLCIGIPVSASATTRSWIFAATAGMFLYVSLVNMVPELAKRKSKSNCRLFILQNSGLILGFGCMFVIAVFEESIFV